MKANVVALLLALCCVARMLASVNSIEVKKKADEHQNIRSVTNKNLTETSNKINNKIITAKNGLLLHRLAQGSKEKVQKFSETKNVKDVNFKGVETRDRVKRRKKRHKNHVMTALLLAYKMKFMALIPTLLGGLILLISKALLAGFFFALFAAVLGLKSH